MKHLAILIKPASSLCNIKCKYCFYADVSSQRVVTSHGVMVEAVMENIVDQLFEAVSESGLISIAFQGGEPTIAGLAYYENFITYVNSKNKKVKVNYSLQTNGLLITEKWCQFFKENNFLIGLSIDAGKEYHDQNRVSASQKGTHRRVMKTKRLFDMYMVEYNMLCVLTNNMARYPQKVLNFIIKENIQYVQFIPCLNDLDAKETNKYALTPERFSRFYKKLYLLWKNEYNKKNYISIKLFDDVYNLVHHNVISACGMTGRCQVQFVIEADGSVYPCDFYVLDKQCLGNIKEYTFSELGQNKIATKFLCKKDEVPSYCSSCEYYRMCFGGCKRMKDAIYVNNDATYCGYQDFLRTCLTDIKTLQ